TYAVPAHTLPSARGQGDPLTGRVSPPDGAAFVTVLMGNAEDLYVLATDAGYGFVVTLGDLHTRQRAGKVVLTVGSNSQILPPIPLVLDDHMADMVAVVSNTGRLLVFPLTELPQLSKGKGYKLIGLSSNRSSESREAVAALVCFQSGQPLTLYCGQRHLTLKPADIERYAGVRGRRGSKLPRGFQRVDRIGMNGQHSEGLV
ncbi:DNA topoisomerase IV subunit A, partial [Candidatus Entotheonella serta]